MIEINEIEKLNNNKLKTYIKSLTDSELEYLFNYFENKEKQYTSIEQSKKKQINSLYGALANEYFCFYNIDIAESITSYIRYYIKSIIKRVELYLKSSFNYTNKECFIYTHTDSIFFNLEPIFENKKYEKSNKIKSLYNECLIILDIIDMQFSYCSKVLNSLEDKDNKILKMEIDTITDEAIWISVSNYFLKNYYQSRLLKYPQFKVVGIEAFKSSSSKFVREFVKNNLNIFFTNNEQLIVNSLLREFDNFKLGNNEDILFSKKISNISHHYVNSEYKLELLDVLNKNYKHIISLFKGKIDNKKIIAIKEIFKEIDIYISLSRSLKIYELSQYFKNLETYIDKVELDLFKKNLNEAINIFNKKFNNPFFSDGYSYIPKKGTLNYIKGAIIYNRYLEENNLKYSKVKDGELVYYAYLKQGNPFDTDIISFVDLRFLKKISNYIDYKKQFEKSFIEPIKQITNALNLNFKIS